MQLIAVLAVLALLLLVWFSLSVVGFLFHLIPVLIVGLVAGAVASAIVGSKHGLLGDMVLGLVGGLLGGLLLHLAFGYSSPNVVTDILVAILGAVILLLLGKGLNRRRAL